MSVLPLRLVALRQPALRPVAERRGPARLLPFLPGEAEHLPHGLAISLGRADGQLDLRGGRANDDVSLRLHVSILARRGLPSSPEPDKRYELSLTLRASDVFGRTMGDFDLVVMHHPKNTAPREEESPAGRDTSLDGCGGPLRGLTYLMAAWHVRRRAA